MKNTTNQILKQFITLLIGVGFSGGNATHAQQIQAAYFHVWAYCPDGSTYRWGYNADGQLSNAGTTNSSSPILLGTPSPVIEAKPGMTHSLALKNDGTVWASGNNTYGQLGNGNNTNQLSFVQTNTITNAVAISCGYDASYALTSTGQVYSWGDNAFGALGDGSTTHRNSPVLLGLTGIVAIEGGADNGYALKNDGTVWSWGYGAYGMIGNGTTWVHQYSPVQVSGLTNVVAISMDYNHCLALKSDGTVWAWGWNGLGQLGDGTTTDRNVPTQVSGLTNVVSIAAGYNQSLAVKNDGTVWAWGGNGFGQLGDGTTTDKLIPTLATSVTGPMTSVSCGLYSSYAVKSDGTMWSWGWNVFGQLGDGTTTDKMAAVQIPITCAVPLPLKLISFEGTCKDKSIELNWATASENNTDYFTIERSTDGNSFIPIKTINAAGNSSEVLYYQISDADILSNQIYYYRLSQTDYDGQQNYFETLSAQSCVDENEDVSFTNPSTGILSFHFSRPNLTASYTVIDNLGQLVLIGELSNSNNTIDLTPFSDGVYHIRLKTGEKVQQEKIILQH